MPTLFTRLALNLKALFWLGFVALLVVGNASANSTPELTPIPEQTLFAEQLFTYQISATDTDGTVPGIRALNSPLSATLDDNGNGTRTFKWLVPADVPPEVIVIFQAFDALDKNLVSTQRMLLRRSDSDVDNTPEQETVEQNLAEQNPAEQEVTSTESISVQESNSAPTLPDIGVQSIRVDQVYQLYIKPIDADGTVAGLSAKALPGGALLEDGFDGSRVLRWRPSLSQTGEHVIVFVATDAQDPSLTSERAIIFEVGEVDSSSTTPVETASSAESEINTANTNENTVDTSNNDTPQSLDNEPYFESISSMVVSVGQKINFRVVPRMPDQSAAILHVDRLPLNASFDDNYDGTRSFYWETTESDQGEHIFRFTAIHHRNANQRVSTDVLIVVGDPAAGGSAPDVTTGSNSAPKLLPIEDQRVAVNSELRFRVQAIDNDGTIPSLYLENMPENVRFEDNGDGSREFLWTPEATQSGVHQFDFVATDQLDASLTDSIVVTVNVVGTDDVSVVPPPPKQNTGTRAANKAEAARFLQRATFGPHTESVTKLMQQTYSDWINDQMNVAQTRYLDGVDSVLREYGLINITDGRRQFDRQQIRSDAFWNITVTAPDQLRQRVAFALGQILVVSDKDAGLDNRVRGIANYHDLLAGEAFGNYRSLLSKVSLNPVMGDFLSMRRNEKPDIENNIQSDENYAREFMQLFTLGLSQLQSNGQPVLGSDGQPVATYTQDDVVNLARVFTGWNYGDAGSMRTSERSTQSEIMPMKAFEDFHDKTQKVIVGNVEIPAGMNASAELSLALDAIFNHPNVPPFVSKQLIQRLVTSNPSTEYVQRVAGVFSDNGHGVRGDLSAVVPAILLDQEALNGHQQDQRVFGKLKEPVVKIASIWRAFDARGEFNKLRYSGIDADFLQNPYSAPSVFNFYSANYKPPGPIANEARVAPEAQILNDTTILRAADRLFDYAHSVPLGNANNSNQHRILLNIDAEKSLANDVPALIDHLTEKLLVGSISDNLRSTLTELGEATPMTDSGAQRVQELLYVLFISPEFSVQL